MGAHSFLSKWGGQQMKGKEELNLYFQFTEPYIAKKFYQTYETFIDK